jgi:ribonuclease BN (tRNA processing enzyme)
VLGPTGNARSPGAVEFVRALFDGKRGAFRYLGDFLDGRASYTIKPRDIKPADGEVRQVDAAPGLAVHASKVTHGHVPAVAWRVEAGGVSIVFSGDTNGDDGVLEKLARGADLFVAHNAVPEGAAGVERFLHMPPSVIGRIAATASVKRLVLSHRMQRRLGKEPETQKAVSERYAGPVSFADDLDCFTVMPHS